MLWTRLWRCCPSVFRLLLNFWRFITIRSFGNNFHRRHVTGTSLKIHSNPFLSFKPCVSGYTIKLFVLQYDMWSKDGCIEHKRSDLVDDALYAKLFGDVAQFSGHLLGHLGVSFIHKFDQAANLFYCYTVDHKGDLLLCVFFKNLPENDIKYNHWILA